jgi:aspartate racemase
VHERYLGELVPGTFKDETRQEFVDLIARLQAEKGVDGVVLGGTELPILLGSGPIAGLPLLDTTELHVRAIVERLEP